MQHHHTQTGAIAIAARDTGSKPARPQPTIVLSLAGLGALTGTAVGRIRRLPRGQTRALAES